MSYYAHLTWDPLHPINNIWPHLSYEILPELLSSKISSAKWPAFILSSGDSSTCNVGGGGTTNDRAT